MFSQFPPKKSIKSNVGENTWFKSFIMNVKISGPDTRNQESEGCWLWILCVHKYQLQSILSAYYARLAPTVLRNPLFVKMMRGIWNLQTGPMSIVRCIKITIQIKETADWKKVIAILYLLPFYWELICIIFNCGFSVEKLSHFCSRKKCRKFITLLKLEKQRYFPYYWSNK